MNKQMKITLALGALDYTKVSLYRLDKYTFKSSTEDLIDDIIEDMKALTKRFKGLL